MHFGQPNLQPVCDCAPSEEGLISFLVIILVQEAVASCFALQNQQWGPVCSKCSENAQVQRLPCGPACTAIYLDKSGGIVNYQAKIITSTFTKCATSDLLCFPTITNSLTLSFVFPQPSKFPRRHSLSPTPIPGIFPQEKKTGLLSLLGSVPLF